MFRQESEIGIGFLPEDKQKVETHLERLLPYIDLRRSVIVGGIAIRYHLSKAGISYPERPFNDLDMVAEDISVVSTYVKDNFLIYHQHPGLEGEFYLVLVDPVSKTKIDIFDNSVMPEETISIKFRNRNIRVTSAEDQFVKTVLDLQRISMSAKVDPKQFEDARLLLNIVDSQKTQELWKRRAFANTHDNIVDALERSENIARAHPELIQKSPFRRTEPYNCIHCVNTPEYPITPMDKIYEILGYVE